MISIVTFFYVVASFSDIIDGCLVSSSDFVLHPDRDLDRTWRGACAFCKSTASTFDRRENHMRNCCIHVLILVLALFGKAALAEQCSYEVQTYLVPDRKVAMQCCTRATEPQLDAGVGRAAGSTSTKSGRVLAAQSCVDLERLSPTVRRRREVLISTGALGACRTEVFYTQTACECRNTCASTRLTCNCPGYPATGPDPTVIPIPIQGANSRHTTPELLNVCRVPCGANTCGIQSACTNP